MPYVAKALIALLAVIHILILLAEMFAWNTMGARLLDTTDAGLLGDTRAMAANQGLYNGFLAAGLIWALLVSEPVWQKRVAVFFLACVAVAGVFGALTVSGTILLVQAVPAAIALFLIVFGWDPEQGQAG